MTITTLNEIPTLFRKWNVAKKVLDRVSIWNGDITKLEVDAIVNAANSRLAGGGGVDGAIHRAAGYQELRAETAGFDGCDVGKAVITSGCNMDHIKKIIHTVGPQIYGQVSESDQIDLQNCYKNSLKLAQQNQLKSIAFCCISTGVYGYPNNQAAHLVSNFLIDFLEKNEEMERIVLVTFLQKDNDFYHENFEKYAEKMDEEEEKNSRKSDDSFEKI